MNGTKLWVLSIVLIVATAATIKFSSILPLFAISAIIAYLLRPLAEWLIRKFRLKRGLAVAVIFLLFIAFVSVVVVALVPVVTSQITSLANDAESITARIQTFADQALALLKDWNLPPVAIEYVNELVDSIDDILLTFIVGVVKTLLSYSMKILDVVIFLVLLFYFMLDGRRIILFIENALPDAPRRRLQHFLHECNDIVWRYLKSHILISGCVGIVTYIGFLLMGSPYAVFFGIMTFVLDFIPYFGSIIAGVVEGVITLVTGGVPMAIFAICFVLAMQQIEGNIIIPKVQGDTVGLHPIAVLFAILACNLLWGPLGMLIAVPVAGFVRIIIKELYCYFFDIPTVPAVPDADAPPDPPAGA